MTEKKNTKQNKNKQRRRERRGYEYVIFEGDSSGIISATKEDPMKFIAVVHPTHHGYSSACWAARYKW